MLQEKLKENTRPLHDQLEQLMFVDEIMQRTLTIDQYKKILLTNYIIHLNYEKLLHENLSKRIADQLDIGQRNKLPALALDLEEIGLTNDNIPSIQILPITTEAFALGALYVLEGSTLGGSMIYKQLLLNPRFNSSLGLHYYNFYGKELMPKWKQFVAVLNNLPLTQHQEAISGANWMFEEIARMAKLIGN